MAHSLKGTTAEMRRINPQNSYYAVTLKADERGNIGWSVQSSWAGFVNEGDFETELREAALVIPDRMADLWRSVGEPSVVVNEESHLYVYVMIGGNALVEQQIAQKWLPERWRWGWQSCQYTARGIYCINTRKSLRSSRRSGCKG